ncbi:MAG: general secretion pathway protein GspE [Proteobacteria bacterium]|nr:general secretion pathway protein GspE [Pseudomonadota bacterium]
MAIKLGEMLVKGGAITLDQLEEALKYQVIFGGKLGTNLIELGYLGEEGIAWFLSEKLGLPYVHPDKLMNILPDVIKIIPQHLASKYKVIPINLEKKRLTLAMADPSDLAAIDEIAFITGLTIKPVVAPEVRVMLALEKYYDIDRDVRYIPIMEKQEKDEEKEAGSQKAIEAIDIDVPPPPTEIVDLEPPAPQEKPPEPELILEEEVDNAVDEIQRGEETVDKKTVEDIVEIEEEVVADILDLEEGSEEIVKEVVEKELEELEEADIIEEEIRRELIEAYSIDEVSKSLAKAKDREEIADILINYAASDFKNVALFLIRSDSAIAWRAMSDNNVVDDISSYQIPLNEPSALKIVAEGKSYYLGPLAETENNKLLSNMFGKDNPPAVLLIPIIIMGKIVNILYVEDSEVNLGEKVVDLRRLANKASMAFEVLVIKNKIIMT